MAGFLLLQAFLKSIADYWQKDLLDNISFYLAIIITGVGFVIRKGIKEEKIPRLGHDLTEEVESLSPIRDTREEEPEVKVPKVRSMRWFKFWTYWWLPAGVVINAIVGFTSLVWPGRISFMWSIFSLAWAVFMWAVYKGLHNKRLSGWKMNYAVIVMNMLAIWGTTGATPPSLLTQAVAILGAVTGLIWAIANSVYFAKRKSYFTGAQIEVAPGEEAQ